MKINDLMEPMTRTELENVLNPLGLTFEIIEIDQLNEVVKVTMHPRREFVAVL